MQTNASSSAATQPTADDAPECDAAHKHRAVVGEKITIFKTPSGEPQYCNREKGGIVQFEEGDVLSLDNIPHDLDNSLHLDGVELVKVRGVDFEFLNHGGQRCPQACFAARGVIVTLVSHAGAAYAVVDTDDGKSLEFFDPAAAIAGAPA